MRHTELFKHRLVRIRVRRIKRLEKDKDELGIIEFTRSPGAFRARREDILGILKSNLQKASLISGIVTPTLTRAASSIGTLEKEWGKIHEAEDVFIEGTALGYAEGDSVTLADGDHTWTFTGEAISSGSDTELVLDYLKAVREDCEHGFNPEADGPLTIAYKGSTLDVEFKAAR